MSRSQHIPNTHKFHVNVFTFLSLLPCRLRLRLRLRLHHRDSVQNQKDKRFKSRITSSHAAASLPTEVHLTLFGWLPYEALLRISATNNHFRDLFLNNRQITIEALLDLEEHAATDARHILKPCYYGVPSYLPCDGCFRILKPSPPVSQRPKKFILA